MITTEELRSATGIAARKSSVVLLQAGVQERKFSITPNAKVELA